MKMQIIDLIRNTHISWLRIKTSELNHITTQNALIVAPHPDDEVIGCGGLIAKMVEKGDMPHIVVMTGGESSHRGCCSVSGKDIKTARRGLTRKALAVLGVTEDHIHELDFPDGGVSDGHREEMEKLKTLVEALKPKTVLVPHWGEGWPDHVNTAKLVRRIVDGDTEIWEYCVWMWYYNVWRGLDWKNAAVFTMTQQEHRLKMKAMEAYVRPLAPCGKPWSGVLPKLFIKAHQGNRELYFRTK